MCWHKWKQWRSYEGKFMKVINNKEYIGHEPRQERECVKCGKSQDREVRC